MVASLGALLGRRVGRAWSRRPCGAGAIGGIAFHRGASLAAPVYGARPGRLAGWVARSANRPRAQAHPCVASSVLDRGGIGKGGGDVARGAREPLRRTGRSIVDSLSRRLAHAFGAAAVTR